MSKSVARPARPYLGQKELDDLVRMNSELMAELWILKDRVIVLEHLLEQKKLLERREITDHVPQGALAQELERERDALVRRVAGAPHVDGYTYQALAAQKDIG